MTDNHPISADDQTRLHQFGKKVLLGIFVGYALYAQGVWKGTILVADVEGLKILDASEVRARRFNAKAVFVPKQGDEFIFPLADGTVKLSGKDQEVRTSIHTRNPRGQGKEHPAELQEADESVPPEHQATDDTEARDDVWSISGNDIHRHHV